MCSDWKWVVNTYWFFRLLSRHVHRRCWEALFDWWTPFLLWSLIQPIFERRRCFWRSDDGFWAYCGHCVAWEDGLLCGMKVHQHSTFASKSNLTALRQWPVSANLLYLNVVDILPVPVEIVSKILANFCEGFPADLDNRNVNLASRLLRTLYRKPKPLQLLTDKRVRDFFTSAEQFHRVFAISMPQIAFCEVQCLELLLPPPRLRCISHDIQDAQPSIRFSAKSHYARRFRRRGRIHGACAALGPFLGEVGNFEDQV